jgi:hypothetical protein
MGRSVWGLRAEVAEERAELVEPRKVSYEVARPIDNNFCKVIFGLSYRQEQIKLPIFLIIS